ncbi:MAG: DUF6531 domain-containing protein, partial [Candidatus Brocadiia bacterium]
MKRCSSSWKNIAGYLGLVMALVIIAQGSIFASAGDKTVSKTENDTYMELTVPVVAGYGSSFKVNLYAQAEAGAMCLSWVLYENGVQIAGQGFGQTTLIYETTRIAQRTPATYLFKARSIGGAHGWPSYSELTNSCNSDFLVGTKRRELGTKVFSASVVDVASGNLNLDYDITNIVPTNNLPHNFTVYYNSLDTENDWPDTYRPLGQKWTHNFNQRLRLDGNIITHVEADGRRVFYQDADLNGTFESLAPYGAYSTIAWNGTTSEYTLTRKDKTFLLFNSQGFLKRIQDRNDYFVLVEYYTGTNKIQTITLPNGRTIGITYYDDDKIYQVIDPATTVTTFEYNTSGYLSAVYKGTGANEWRRDFTYKNTPLNYLVYQVTSAISVSPAQSDTVEYNYDGLNRVVNVTRNIDGAPATKTYNYLDPLTQTEIIDFDLKSSTVNFTYETATLQDQTDALGNKITSVFDTNGNLTEYKDALLKSTFYGYDTRGNVILVTDALGNQTSYDYTIDGVPDTINPDLPKKITVTRVVWGVPSSSVETTFAYNSNGNMTQKVEASNYAYAQTTDYAYYTTGSNIGKLQMETKYPSAGVSIITEYTYLNGYLDTKTVDSVVGGLNLQFHYLRNSRGQVTREYDSRYYPADQTVYTEYQYDIRGNNTFIIRPTRAGATVTTKMDYDLMDNLIARTEDYTALPANGKNVVTKYNRDNLGRLTSTVVDYGVTGKLNLTTANQYYKEGRIKQVTEPNGAITGYTYYDNGWLDTVTKTLNGTDSVTTKYEYFDNGRVQWVILNQGTEADERITGYTYTDRGEVSTVTVKAENGVDYTTTYNYPINSPNLPDWVQDARLNKIYYYYDALGRVAYFRTPQSNITTAYQYDQVGRQTAVIGPWHDTNQDGSASGEYTDIPHLVPAATYNTFYDKANRVSETWVTGYPHTFYYYSKLTDKTIHWVQSPVDTGVTQIVESYYDQGNRLMKTIVDPGTPPANLNETTYYTYNTLGQVEDATTAYETALATVTHSEYDNVGRLKLQYTGSLTYATRYDYAFNTDGLLITITDAEGYTAIPQYYTTSQYDKGGRLTKVTTAKGGNNYTRYEYDRVGNRTGVYYYKDTAEVATTYTYYKNNLLHTADYPGYGPLGTERNVVTYVYDANGNLYTKTDFGAAHTITHGYDLNNRMISKFYPETSPTYSASFSYDARGNTLTAIDPYTNLENVFDVLGRLTSVTCYLATPAKVVSYTYFDDGTRKTMVDNDNSITISYTYDKAKRLLNVKRNTVNVGTYVYNALGLRTRLTYGNNAWTEYGYHPTTRWLTSVINKRWVAHNIIASSFAYTHDLVGNRKTMTLLGGDVVTYDYDDNYQLLSESRVGASQYSISWIDTVTGVSYDQAGNRKVQIMDGVRTDYVYNHANQLTSETGGITYEYDANGNLVTKKVNTVTVAQWGYDWENRQISFTDINIPTNNSQYYHCVFNKRISKVVNGAAERYLFDGANVIADYDDTGALMATYITPFLDDNLYVNRYVDSNWQTYYYMHDGLGSVSN